MSDTSMAAAFRKAGIDPDMRQLRALAQKYLTDNNTPERALAGFLRALDKQRDLLRVLAFDFLCREHLGPSHPDAQKLSAESAAAPAKQLPMPDRVTPAGGPDEKPVKVRAHRRSYSRHGDTQQAAIDARAMTVRSLVFDHRFDGRRLGDFTRGELPQLQRDLVSGTAGFIRYGTESARYALLIDKIMYHGEVDPEMRVEEFISPQLSIDLDQQAIAETPKLIETGVRYFAQALTEQIEHART